MSEISFRLETGDDFRAVEELTREAFWNNFVPGCDEHFLLHKLRSHPDFIPELDFVAEIDGVTVGHIAYSKSSIVNKTTGAVLQTITFGPISVHPEHQGKGVGTQLIRHSTRVAKDLGYVAVVIYGDPKFYGRCGFRSADRFDVTNPQGEFCVAMQVLPLQPHALDGVSGEFHESSIFEELDPAEAEQYDHLFPTKEKEVKPSQAVFKLLCSLKYKALE